MTLDEIAEAAPFPGAAKVPPWTLGCFHRRSITYASGEEDTETRVVWIQSGDLTGDIRIPAGRPDLSGRRNLADCSREQLAALAEAEGGVADTRFRRGRMSWDNWVSFQPYNKWPEPGDLRRVGGCLMEFAPSGAYVEDWRFQPGSEGLRVGLRLVSETGEDGVARPRDGGLVVAGEHVIQVLGRRRALHTSEPAAQQIRAATDLAAVVADVFDCEASYLRRVPDRHHCRVVLSTEVVQEGEVLPLLEGFSPGSRPGFLRQLGGTVSAPVTRNWRIDTLV